MLLRQQPQVWQVHLPKTRAVLSYKEYVLAPAAALGAAA
jgi:hypothetical protein